MCYYCGVSPGRIVARENNHRNSFIAMKLRFDDSLETLESVPMITTELLVLCLVMSELRIDNVSKKSSSCHDVSINMWLGCPKKISTF